MEQYAVKGMMCAACQARVEKAVQKVPGVTEVTVSLLTNSMAVEGSASSADIVKAVKNAGYGARLKKAQEGSDGHEDHMALFKELRRNFIVSLLILLPLMYVSMGGMLFSTPLLSYLSARPALTGLIEAVLSLAILVINRHFFINGFKGAVHLAPNMDTLVALGSGVSFLYSLWKLTALLVSGGLIEVHDGMDMAGRTHFYFESAAMILVLITLGKMLEALSKGRTTGALQGLLKLAPETASVVRNGEEVRIPTKELVAGDIFLVRPGESFPVDGVVEEGSSSVNEAALTGESIPVDKEADSPVSAGTLNETGFLRCRAEHVGSETMLAKIIRMVSDSAATKAPIARIADKVAGIFVPAVIGIAIVTFVIWMLLGSGVETALNYAISVLVISCPCALGLATPVAIMVGNGVGAKNGILFKTSEALEECGKVKIMALDKTGTLTKGSPSVTDVVPLSEGLLPTAYALEIKSEHPLARAVVRYAEEQGLSAPDTEDFEAAVGNGLSARKDGKMIHGGKAAFIEKAAVIPAELKEKAEALSSEGKTPLFFSEDDRVLGLIAVADTLKDDAAEAIAELKDLGIRTLMLSGDNRRAAGAVGKAAGVDEVVSELLPDEKEEKIRALREEGKVVMVGDGINDAPALTSADIGIAIGAGTDIAVAAADVVLVKDELQDLPKAVRLSRATLRNIKQNLFWAFFYNVLCIPLAAGAYASLGLSLNPMIGAAAMSLSSFFVVMNALRLNLVKLGPKK
ncbi:MAG: copper-translocating P-type ATPase [Lachnospiraceae bacterium]|nr:copper-translocating P-type ATPase [Lachnospiraceae bacterium]